MQRRGELSESREIIGVVLGFDNSQAAIDRIHQNLRPGCRNDIRLHLVHGIAEGDVLVRIGKSN